MWTNGSLPFICSLNGCRWAESACYYTRHQGSCCEIKSGSGLGIRLAVNDTPKAIEVKVSSAESCCWTSQFLTHDNSPDTLLNTMASTKKKTQSLSHKLASLLCHFFKLPGSHVTPFPLWWDSVFETSYDTDPFVAHHWFVIHEYGVSSAVGTKCIRCLIFTALSYSRKFWWSKILRKCLPTLQKNFFFIFCRTNIQCLDHTPTTWWPHPP